MSAGALSTLAGDPAFRRQRRELLMASPLQTGVDWVELDGADAGRLHLKVHFVPGRDPAKKAMVYDFRRPDRIAKDQLRAIHLLHENAKVLSSQYRGDVLEVEAEVPESVKRRLSEYLAE